MEQELSQFLEIVKKIELFFEKAILFSQTQPRNHHILDKQFELPINIQSKVYANCINTNGYVGFGSVSFDEYSQTLINALNSAPEKTAEILDAHKNILQLIKKFADIKLNFVETNSHLQLPYTVLSKIKNDSKQINADKVANKTYNTEQILQFGQHSPDTDKAHITNNDYVALFKIIFTIDLINSKLQACTNRTTIRKPIKNVKIESSGGQKTTNLSLIRKFLKGPECLIQFENIDISPIPEEIIAENKRLYHFFRHTLGLNFSALDQNGNPYKENLYEPEGESHYGEYLPDNIDQETSDLQNTQKPKTSSADVKEKLLKTANESDNISTINPNLFVTLIEYLDYTSKLSEVINIPCDEADERQPQPAYFKFLDRAFTLLRFLDLSRRFHFKMDMLEDQRLYHALNEHSRYHSYLHGFVQQKNKAEQYFHIYRLERLNLCIKIIRNRNPLKKHTQAKHFLLKLASSLRENAIHSIENKHDYLTLYDTDQAIAQIAKISAFNSLPTIPDIPFYKKNKSIEMQEKKFEIEHLDKVLRWKEIIENGDYKNYVEKKYGPQLTDTEKNQIDTNLKSAATKLIRHQFSLIANGYPDNEGDVASPSDYNKIRRLFQESYLSVINIINTAFKFDPAPYIQNQIQEDHVPDLSSLDLAQQKALCVLLSCVNKLKPNSECEINDLGQDASFEDLYFYYLLFDQLKNEFSGAETAVLQKSYSDQKKLYEEEMNGQDPDTAEGDNNLTQNSIETSEGYDIYDYKTAPVTPEDRLIQHNQELFEQYKEQSEALRQQYTSQKIYVPLFEQLYLNQQVHAQQNVQNNIVQLQPRIQQQLAATGTDGLTVSSPSRRSRNHMAPIRQLPSVKSNTTKASPPIVRVRNFAHPIGIMIGGMYISRVIAYKATHNAKFADRLSELSAYPIASSLLYYYANNVGVAGGFMASSRAALYYTATKVPPVAAATAVATIIATPFVQLKKYADMANYNTKIKRKQIISSVLFQAKQDPDYFAQIFYSHGEREDLFNERYGAFSLNKTDLQIMRDFAFMDYELADTALFTMTSMLDMKQDEALNEKKSVLMQIRSNALSFLKSTYPKRQSSNINFGTFDHFK